MSFSETLRSREPRPGALLEALERAGEAGDTSVLDDPILTLDEQRRVAADRLDAFLANIADAPGARRVVERYYREERGRDVDASDVEELRDLVPDVEAVIDDGALPRLSKEDLREHYGVEGAWGKIDEAGHERPSLVPDWVRNDEDEPELMNFTGGTTGDPWERAMTRNDTAVMMASCMRIAHHIVAIVGGEPERWHVANPWPHPASREFIGRAVRMLGMGCEIFDDETLTAGGDRESETVGDIIEYLAAGDRSFIVFPIQRLMQGKFGVELRRGNVDVDVVVNAGAPFPERQRREIEDAGIRVVSLYGETEYPEMAIERTVDGVTGYDLPMNAQINLVYDDESSELLTEGRGRFAYFAYGLEGHVVPGVYLSGVRATIERVGERQMLRDVERIDDGGGDCDDV